MTELPSFPVPPPLPPTAREAGLDETPIQVQVALMDLPTGQRLATGLTLLLGKDAAIQLADAIKHTAGQMSSTRLVVANGSNLALGEHPS